MSPVSPSSADSAVPLIPADCRQLLRVLAADWSSSVAQLQAFSRTDSRTDAAAPWQPYGPARPVSLGRNGLAWGVGLHPAGLPGPQKQEGDGRAPAGLFALSALFHPASTPPDPAWRLPAHATHADLLAVDDPASRHYNQLVDRRQLAGDWHSAEAMLRDDERYRLGLIVAHNPPPAMPGAGSCIFIHVWAAPGIPTAGCTALDLTALQDLCRWLDAAARPCLLQLPAPEYALRRQSWALP